MYVLNLVFDCSKIPADGLFEDYDKAQPNNLKKSLCWLKLLGKEPADPNDTSFVPENENWDDLGYPAALLLRKKDKPGWICIRAVPKPGSLQPDKLQLVAAFGRPSPYDQPQASPFTHDGDETGRIKTTFVFGPDPANKGSAWLYNLKEIAKPGGKEHTTHRYEFSVGLIVTTSAGEYHFGEDPEMDIEM